MSQWYCSVSKKWEAQGPLGVYRPIVHCSTTFLGITNATTHPKPNMNTSTVMGTEHSYSMSNSTHAAKPPRFETNQTPKFRYREALRRWIKRLHGIAKYDEKYRGILETAGHSIFENCDTLAQDRLLEAEASGKLLLDGSSTDPTRTELVEVILEIIAKDLPTETVQREVSLLRDIHSCIRKSDETPTCYANRFYSLVARYSIQTGDLDKSINRQFAVLMIENARLSNDTRSSLIFKLTTECHTQLAPACITIPVQLFARVMAGLQEPNATTNKTLIEELEVLYKKAMNNHDRTGSSFGIENVSATLRQVTISPDLPTQPSSAPRIQQTSLLGKRSNDDNRKRFVKKSAGCSVCGDQTHWWKDNDKCRNIVEKKRDLFRNSHRMSTDDIVRQPTELNSQSSHNSSDNKRIFHFSGSVKPFTDPNPIIDDGAPHSIGGTIEACTLCDLLGLNFNVIPASKQYSHGWGNNALDAKPICFSWDLFVLDSSGKPTVLNFDLIERSAPLIVGLDVREYAQIDNNRHELSFQRPTDKSERCFNTYIATDVGDNKRARIMLLPHYNALAGSLLCSTYKGKESHIAKKLHRVSHAPKSEMITLLRDAGVENKKIFDHYDAAYDSCDICASSGRPRNKIKVSLKHVNEAFNETVQADYMVVYINEEKFEVLNIVDTGTAYGERSIAPSRSSDNMKAMLESMWICRHGTPKRFATDPEFCKLNMKQFLAGLGIALDERPSRSSHKIGIVERNNGVFKAVLDEISRKKTTAIPTAIVSRASFLTNLFKGSSVLSSFQLARGYSPSIAGIPSTIVPKKLLDAHIEMMAARAIHKVLKARASNSLPRHALHKGMRIWVFYDTSKQNERKRWIEARVISADDHLVKCRRFKKGPPLNVAYKHIRIASKTEFDKELMESSFEKILEDPSGNVINMETQIAKSKASDTVIDDLLGEADESEVDDVLNPIGFNHPPTVSSFFSSCLPSNGTPELDVGKVKSSTLDENLELLRNEHADLDILYGIVGSKTLKRKELDLAPSWLLDKAISEEVDSNWADAYEVVHEKDVPEDANVIGSHIIFKI